MLGEPLVIATRVLLAAAVVCRTGCESPTDRR